MINPNLADSDDFSQDWLEKLCYDDVVVRSGVAPEIFPLNFKPISGNAIYEENYQDSDKTTNSGISLEAARNLARCTGDAGYFYRGKFWLLSDLCGASWDARNGKIKSEGIYRPAGAPAAGWICNGRVRQLTGAPIALDDKDQPRRYHQPKGQPLEVFFPKVTVTVWREIAAKHNLAMPEFPAVGVGGEALEFWGWAIEVNCPIVITEGEKKACCLISRGHAAICVPGITSGYRITERGEWIEKPDGTRYQKAIAWELLPELKFFDTPGRDITILFDFRTGDYSQSQEFKAACTTAKLFKSAIGKIAQLPGSDKGVDDFAVAGGDIDGVISAAQDIKKVQAEKLWRSYRGFSPDVKTNTRYFEAPAPKSGTITAVRSGLGTGKTEWLKNKVASDATGAQINLTHRNSLGLQLAEKLVSNHLDAHDGYKFFLDPNARLTLCIDSLMKVPPERLQGCTLIIDESASVIKHLLCSNTLFSKRLEILERFELACQVADRLVLSDGNQADWVVNYIATLAGNKAVLKIENQFKGDTPPVTFLIPPLDFDIFGKLKRQHKRFFEWYAEIILDSECPAIATDSLQQAEALARRFESGDACRAPLSKTEKQRKEVRSGILITSKTVTEPHIKEFLKDPDAYIAKHKPAWIIFTPTAESGVDISIPDYFSDIFCWFVGVLGVDECMQMTRRVRNPIGQIYIYCAERGLPATHDSGATYYKQIAENIAARVTVEAVILTDEALTEATKTEIELQAKSPHFLTYCKIQAKENLERRDLRGYLFKAFAAAGYQPKMQDGGGDQEGELQKIAKEECRDLACQEIFKAEDITFKEAEEIERKYSANWPDRCKVIKFKILEKLPGLKDSEFWDWEFVRRLIYEDRELRSQLEAAWLFNNQEDAEYLQRRKWQEPFRGFLPDVSDRWLKLRAMKGLGLEVLLQEKKAWTANSPEVREIIKRCKKKDIANILGYPTPKYEMRFMLIAEQVRTGDERFWQYRYQPTATVKLTKVGPVRISSLPENWEELMSFTASRMAEKVAFLKQAEMLASKDFEFVTDAPINVIKKGVSVTNPDSQTEQAERAEPQPEPVGRKAWVKRWGEWVRASFLAATDGAQYRMLIEQATGWCEVFAFPENIQWDET
jgi:hypothetical protein